VNQDEPPAGKYAQQRLLCIYILFFLSKPQGAVIEGLDSHMRLRSRGLPTPVLGVEYAPLKYEWFAPRITVHDTVNGYSQVETCATIHLE